MGVDVSNSLLVGAYYEELADFIQSKIDSEEFEEDSEVIDEFFNSASPYYDSPTEEHFLGFRVPNQCILDEDWFVAVKKLAEHFEELTGVKPCIRGGAHVF